MLVRIVFLLVLFFLSVVFVKRNPAPTPELPDQARLQKVDATGKILSAWGGPWKCVYDSKTQLLWEVKSYAEDIHDHQCSFSWFIEGEGAKARGDCFLKGEASDTQELIDLANRHRYCGTDGWRLPSESELKTLIIEQPKPGEPFIATDYFPFSKRGPYWTSDKVTLPKEHSQQHSRARIALNFASGKRELLAFETATFTRLVTAARENN